MPSSPCSLLDEDPQMGLGKVNKSLPKKVTNSFMDMEEKKIQAKLYNTFFILSETHLIECSLK